MDHVEFSPTLDDLLVEYGRATAFTAALWQDLDNAELHWRPNENASAIGWHVGHQGVVAHFLVRNLTAAEPSMDRTLDTLFDSATAEPERGVLPSADKLANYRQAIDSRLRIRISDINNAKVGAPAQLSLIARGLLLAVINHEYQHNQWIGEVRSGKLQKPSPSRPTSPLLQQIDGYQVVAPPPQQTRPM